MFFSGVTDVPDVLRGLSGPRHADVCAGGDARNIKTQHLNKTVTLPNISVHQAGGQSFLFVCFLFCVLTCQIIHSDVFRFYSL